MRLFVLGTLAFLAFSQLAVSAETGVSDSEIKIGYIGALSGPNASAGLSIMHGIQAQFKKVNAAGGINGRKLVLIAEDDGYEPEKASAAFKKLASQEKVFAFVSVYGSPSNSAVAPLVEREGIPLIGPITIGNLAEPVRKNIFVVRPVGNHDAEMMVLGLVDDLGIKEIGVVYQDDSLGTAGVSGLEKALAQRQLKLKVRAAIKRNSADVDEAVAAIRASAPKAIFIFSTMPGTAEFAKKILSSPSYAPILLGTLAASSPEFMKAVANLNIKYFAGLALPPVTDTSLPLSASYAKDLAAAGFSDATQQGIEGYLNASVMVEGLQQAGKDLTRASLRAALETFKDQNFGGYKISFSPTSHSGHDTPFLSKYSDGALHLVKSMK